MMIGLWFFGDGFRFIFYVMSKSPAQFVIGGVLTLLMDTVVLVQFFMWRHKSTEDPQQGDVVMTFEGDVMQTEVSRLSTDVSVTKESTYI